MIVNLIIWLIVIVVTVAFGWLVTRAWRAKNPLAKWGGVVLSGLLTLVAALIVVVSAMGLIRL